MRLSSPIDQFSQRWKTLRFPLRAPSLNRWCWFRRSNFWDIRLLSSNFAARLLRRSPGTTVIVKCALMNVGRLRCERLWLRRFLINISQRDARENNIGLWRVIYPYFPSSLNALCIRVRYIRCRCVSVERSMYLCELYVSFVTLAQARKRTCRNSERVKPQP